MTPPVSNAEISFQPFTTMGSPPVTTQCYEAGKDGTTKLVTITILNMTGLHMKDTGDTTSTATLVEKKTKLTKRFNFRGSWNKRNNKDVDEVLLKDVEIGTEAETEAETEATDESTSADTTDASSSPNIVSNNTPKPTTNTFVVASISRPSRCKSGKVAMTHLSSLPIHFPKKSKSIMIHGIRWPGGWNSGTICEALEEKAVATRTTSSYRFKHTFQPEKKVNELSSPSYSSASSSSNSKSHTLPIRISICRSGQLYKLGTANVMLSGEMDGMTYVNIPIVCSNPHLQRHTSRFTDILDRGRKSRAPAMMKLRNETLSCGLDRYAAIQVLIQCDVVTESVIEQEVVLSKPIEVGSLRVIIAKEKDVLSSKMVGSSPLVASPLAEVAATSVAEVEGKKELGTAGLSSYYSSSSQVTEKEETYEEEDVGELSCSSSSQDTEKEETYEEDVGELSCTSSAYMSANVADRSKTDTDTTVSTYDDMSEEDTSCLTETTFVELVASASADHKPFDQSDFDESDILCDSDDESDSDILCAELPYPAAMTNTSTYNCKATSFQQGIMRGMQMLSICADADSEFFTDDEEYQDKNDDDTILLHSYESQI